MKATFGGVADENGRTATTGEVSYSRGVERELLPHGTPCSSPRWTVPSFHT